MLCALFLVTASVQTFADDGEVERRQTRFYIDAKVNFLSAAYVYVEHEKFIIPNMDRTFLSGKTFKKDTYISVHGMPGEEVNVTCQVDHSFNKKMKTLRANRDCAGEKQAKIYSAISGQKIDNPVEISQDMLAKGEEQESFISLQVSYI